MMNDGIGERVQDVDEPNICCFLSARDDITHLV